MLEHQPDVVKQPLLVHEKAKLAVSNFPKQLSRCKRRCCGRMLWYYHQQALEESKAEAERMKLLVPLTKVAI